MGSKIERIEQKIIFFPSLSPIPFTPFRFKVEEKFSLFNKIISTLLASTDYFEIDYEIHRKIFV